MSAACWTQAQSLKLGGALLCAQEKAKLEKERAKNRRAAGEMEEAQQQETKQKGHVGLGGEGVLAKAPGGSCCVKCHVMLLADHSCALPAPQPSIRRSRRYVSFGRHWLVLSSRHLQPACRPNQLPSTPQPTRPPTHGAPARLQEKQAGLETQHAAAAVELEQHQARHEALRRENAVLEGLLAVKDSAVAALETAKVGGLKGFCKGC